MLKMEGEKKRNWQPSKKKRRKIDLWQWNCQKWEGKKKRIVAMKLPKIGERKLSSKKKKICNIDSYSKKYIYSYYFL